MNLIDNIQSTEYIYSIYTKWGLKKFTCDVSYFTEEPLDDLYYVICSILETNNGYYDKHSLGILLGFSMCDQSSNGNHETYYDVAEVYMFENILAKVEAEHLIRIQDRDIFLTNLGLISLKEEKHYQFYIGSQNLYEHLKQNSDTPMVMTMFPFYSDMGIFTVLDKGKQEWPNDEQMESIIYAHSNSNPLIKRLECQSKEKSHIYKVHLQEYFDIEFKKVHVKLYQSGEKYMPVIMNGDIIAKCATELIYNKLNTYRREDLVLECLFQKLWDDENAVLDYAALQPYVDLVDYEELTKDSRIVWTDNDLLSLIIDRANQICWKNISRHCVLSMLYAHIEEIKDNLDWPIFTVRVDDEFLINHFIEYPWDLEILSEDINRKESTIEQLILLQKETEEEWNWEELEHRLSESFVLSHLAYVKVNLSSYTNDTEEVRGAILANIDKRWDWNKVEANFDLSFIYKHIVNLGECFTFTQLFDRIFTDKTWAIRFATNQSFVKVLKKASEKNGALGSCILNDKEYVWEPEVIDTLSEVDLINWTSTPYMIGFECNPSLSWSKSFFSKYSSFVQTEQGLENVSKLISDISVLIENPSFGWNWNAISSNIKLLNDSQLYTTFGKQLNWTVVFENQSNIILLQSVEGIDAMIDDDIAWSAFSAMASLDYIIKQYKNFNYPWDWTVLTERMFKKLKLENIGHPLFIEKWDWSYLSEHVEMDYLDANLDKFKNYWNWETVFHRILTVTNKLDFTYLDRIANIITNISGTVKSQAAWTALTSKYSFSELKKLIKGSVSRRAYWWDIKYFSLHEEFNVFHDLEDCRNIVNWDILSSSPIIDDCFKFNPKFKIKPKAWDEDVIKILLDTRNRWNFKLLSLFASLRDQKWFVGHFKDKLDWDVISRTSKVFCITNKQELNEIIEAYKQYINFKLLSIRDDVDITQIIKIYPEGGYDYNTLMEKSVISITMDIVKSLPQYKWDWYAVTSSKSFYPTVDFLLDKIDENLNWKFLSEYDNQGVWSNEELIIAVSRIKKIFEQINWKILSGRSYFPIKNSVLSIVPVDKLNWKQISRRKLIIQLIDEYKDYIDWSELSANKHLLIANTDILDSYKKNLDWQIICKREDFILANEVLECYPEYIDWDLASASLSIDFSRTLVDKYHDKWNWPVLVKNKAFHNKVDISNMSYVKQINIVDFIQYFPRQPKAYHFTHMSNAIKIIKSMKLLSRNYAEGNFSNSAGSNVHRTAKAHRFARFYFAPKSPTQYYNECLGKSRGDKNYVKAYNLGLPKCPLPVFFVFDVEELLMTMPDRCYYSNGNMQKDSSRSFKVTEEPNRIKAREIYINSYDTFDERQQEFLIEGELDFSNLKKVQICCYDSDQEYLLRKELKGTKWENMVCTALNLYERANRELYFDDSDNLLKIDTNYIDPFEFRVSYSENFVPEILNKNQILRQKDDNIYVSSSVEIKKDTPFEIYFEVKDPRVDSWLVYKNR